MTRQTLRSICAVMAGSAWLALSTVGHAQPALSEDVAALIERGDTASAIALLEPRVAAGEAEAQLLYGRLLLNGIGVPQDDSAAMTQFLAAAEQGLPGAMNEFGRGLIIGRGRAADQGAGLDWLGRSARSGQPSMAYDYAVALEAYGGEGRLGEAVDWYRRAIEQGHLPAVTSLGVLYLEGRGVEADPARALSLFQRAAQGGDARAQKNLGLM